jgi:hypothetical protein
LWPFGKLCGGSAFYGREADMDRESIKRTLREQFERSLDQAVAAVQEAPDGQWIAASEWQVREIFQKLMSQSYQQILQARLDEAVPKAAFSPSGPQQIERQGKASGARADRRR